MTSSSRTLGWSVIEVWWAGQSAIDGCWRLPAVMVVAVLRCCTATAPGNTLTETLLATSTCEEAAQGVRASLIHTPLTRRGLRRLGVSCAARQTQSSPHQPSHHSKARLATAEQSPLRVARSSCFPTVRRPVSWRSLGRCPVTCPPVGRLAARHGEARSLEGPATASPLSGAAGSG